MAKNANGGPVATGGQGKGAKPVTGSTSATKAGVSRKPAKAGGC